MIELEMKYTRQNLQKAFKLHYNKAFPVRGRILQVLGFLLIWVGALLILIYKDSTHRTINFIYIIAGLFFIGLHSYLMSNLGKFTYKRIKHPDQVFKFTISDEKILVSSSTSGVSLEWEQIVKAILDKEVIILYVSKLQFYFLPKENFATGDFEKCTELVREKGVKILK
jgi:hypothetical protein